MAPQWLPSAQHGALFGATWEGIFHGHRKRCYTSTEASSRITRRQKSQQETSH